MPCGCFADWELAAEQKDDMTGSDQLGELLLVPLYFVCMFQAFFEPFFGAANICSGVGGRWGGG